jgi:hypothetical protein
MLETRLPDRRALDEFALPESIAGDRFTRIQRLHDSV